MASRAAREAWRDWLKSERRLAAHTLVAYEHDVATFLGFMTTYLGEPPTLDALGKLKPAEFRAWLAERARQGLARTSTARAFSSVRSFFQFLDKRGLAHNASIGAIQTPKLPRSVPKALSERDMEELLEAPAEQEREAWLDLRDAAVLLLLYGAGLRIGEALGLTKGVVEDLLKTGRDTLAVTGKGNKTRLVPLLPQALEALRRLSRRLPLARRPRPGRGLLRRRPRRRARPRHRAEARARHPARSRPRRKRDAARAAPFLRHPSAGRRRRSQDHPGAFGPRLAVDDPALHRRRRRPPHRRLSRRALSGAR